MRLTGLQADMLMHRLNVPDCIFDTFLDTEEPKYTEHQVELAIGCVKEMVNKLVIGIESLDECGREVLRDCIDGSVYLAALYERNNPTPEYTKAKRAAADLEKKLRTTFAFHAEFPRT